MKTRKVLKLGRGDVSSSIIEEQLQIPKAESRGRMLHVLSLASELGFAISLPIAGGAFLGHVLDLKFNTEPRLTLSFIFIGVFIGGTNIYLIMKEMREN